MRGLAKSALLLSAIVLMGCNKDSNDNTVYEEPAVPEELFSVVSINVDGLPKTISFIGIEIDVNKDGPGSEFSSEVGKYLIDRNYDFIALQENFNYDTLVYAPLSAVYNRDPWGGEISVNSLSNLRFLTDGLNGFWKKEIDAIRSDSIAWSASYGKFNHGWDDIITKGFRRYDLKLTGGSKVVIYNMHMDAGDDLDEAKGLDGPDQRTRMVQWRQLRDYILEHLDNTPAVIVGDMNSWYERDSIKKQFIDYIAGTGYATAGDVWIELERGGVYPDIFKGIVTNDPGSQFFSRNGEVLDKILYVNPKHGSQLKPMNILVDSVGYIRNDGSPIGDHSPVSITFKIINQI